MRILTLAILVASPAVARADGTLLSDDTWDFKPGGDLVVDGGLAVALPAALPTGLAMGIGAGVARSVRNGEFQLGGRVEGLTTSESSATWMVTQTELRLRGTAAITTTAGRATIALRFGLGGNLVHETRTREQGHRAGLTGSMLEQRALAVMPAADLAFAIDLHVAGHWMFALALGPTIDLVNGRDLHPGWTSMLGVGWR